MGPVLGSRAAYGCFSRSDYFDTRFGVIQVVDKRYFSLESPYTLMVVILFETCILGLKSRKISTFEDDALLFFTPVVLVCACVESSFLHPVPMS